MPGDTLQTEKLHFEVWEIHEFEDDSCNKICESLKCFYRKCVDPSGSPVIKITRIILVISNIDPEPVRISCADIVLVDNENFSYFGKEFCFKYSSLSHSYSGIAEIPPLTRIRFEVVFNAIKEDNHAVRLLVKTEGRYDSILLHTGNKADTSSFSLMEKLNKKILLLEKENESLKQMLEQLKQTNL